MNHYTYILTPYEPIRQIKNDDLTSYHILLESIKNKKTNLIDLNEQIFEKIGKNNTVYGIQKDYDSDDISVEYYFYNHNEKWQNNDKLSWETVKNLVGEQLDDELKKEIPIDFHFGMFSLDIPENNQKITDVDVYHMEPQNGFCLRWNKNGLFNKNKYSFYYDPSTLEEEMVKREIPNACLLFGNYNIWNESVCISIKREQFYSIYYCQVNIDTLILFLKRLEYPNHIINYFETNKDKLDHMLFDLGYDFDLVPGGMMKIIKGGFYGYF